MRVWRLALGRFYELDGEGARLYGGRWNSPGVPMVYAASHISLALLEQLVHVDLTRFPTAFRALAIELPDDVPIETAALVPDDILACRQYGDAWTDSVRSAALIVPSIVVPSSLLPGEIPTVERNVLLNPRHASASSWRTTETSFRVDPRLSRTNSRQT